MNQGEIFYTANMGHVVNILPPVSLNGGKSSDVFDMEYYTHASIIVQLGANVGSATTITVEECDNFTPSTHTEIAFSVYKCESAASDVLGAKVAATTSGFAAVNNATANIFYVIELDSQQLSDGYNKVRISFSDPSGAQLASAVAILSGARYSNSQSATVVA